jgi:hypothetical protein
LLKAVISPTGIFCSCKNQWGWSAILLLGIFQKELAIGMRRLFVYSCL